MLTSRHRADQDRQDAAGVAGGHVSEIRVGRKRDGAGESPVMELALTVANAAEVPLRADRERARLHRDGEIGSRFDAGQFQPDDVAGARRILLDRDGLNGLASGCKVESGDPAQSEGTGVDDIVLMGPSSCSVSSQRGRAAPQ